MRKWLKDYGCSSKRYGSLYIKYSCFRMVYYPYQDVQIIYTSGLTGKVIVLIWRAAVREHSLY